jgi:hypothetical protein
VKKLLLVVAALVLSGCGGRSLLYKKTCDQKIGRVVAQCEDLLMSKDYAWAFTACNLGAHQLIYCREHKGKVSYNLPETCDTYLSSDTVKGLLDTGVIKGIK